MFEKKNLLYRGRDAIIVSGLDEVSLSDTFLCGQAFRFEQTAEEDGYVEYMTVIGDSLIFVGQKTAKKSQLLTIKNLNLTIQT